jgi:hypothetical protein
VLTACSDLKKGFDDGVAEARATGTATQAPVTTTPRPATATPEATFRAKIGAAATYSDGWKVSVLTWGEQPASRLTTPKPGARFVFVTVRYDNGTAKESSFNPYDWKLQDAAGVRRQSAFFVGDRGDALSSGSVAPGGFVSGSIVFEAPVGDVRLEMVYDIPFQYRVATWELY